MRPGARRWIWLAAGLVGAACGASGTAIAQDPPTPDSGTIVTTGTSEVTVAPDRALLRLDLQATDATTSGAARRHGDLVRSVTDTLAGLGFDRDDVPTRGYAVVPNCEYTRDGRRCNGYLARAVLEVTITDLAQVASVIDAALVGGATAVASLSFQTSDPDAARQEALRLAVAAARTDAETLAGAAGGRLGGLVEFSTATGGGGFPEVMAQARAADGGIVITPEDIVIRATVTARWRFRP